MKELVVPDDAVLVPLSGRICVEVTGVRQAMFGPLYLPQQAAGDQNVGVVRQVYEPYIDDYNNYIEPTVQVGDIVVMGKFTGTRVQLNRENFIICREMDVLACLRTPEQVKAIQESRLDGSNA